MPHVLSSNEIFLRPGEHFFGTADNRIRTVLGSCVSLVFWHPDQRIGGMCHYMLPSRGAKRGATLSGIYGDEALELLLKEIRVVRAHPKDFRVRLFGGGDMFPGVSKNTVKSPVGQQNVRAARQMIETHQLNCISSHVEGVGHRHIMFDIRSGQVTLKLPPLSSFTGR